MKPNPITEAVGALKLAALHLHNQSAVPRATVQHATAESIQHLEQLNPDALQLMTLHNALVAILPKGLHPHVSINPGRLQMFSLVITDQADNIALRANGISIDGLVAVVATRLNLKQAA